MSGIQRTTISVPMIPTFILVVEPEDASNRNHGNKVVEQVVQSNEVKEKSIVNKIDEQHWNNEKMESFFGILEQLIIENPFVSKEDGNSKVDH